MLDFLKETTYDNDALLNGDMLDNISSMSRYSEQPDDDLSEMDKSLIEGVNNDDDSSDEPDNESHEDNQPDKDYDYDDEDMTQTDLDLINMMFQNDGNNDGRTINKKGADISWLNTKTKNVNLSDLDPDISGYMNTLPSDIRNSLVATSGNDDTHAPHSKHYSGDAIDLRYNDNAYKYITNDPLFRSMGLKMLDPNHGTAKHMHIEKYAFGGTNGDPLEELKNKIYNRQQPKGDIVNHFANQLPPSTEAIQKTKKAETNQRILDAAAQQKYIGIAPYKSKYQILQEAERKKAYWNDAGYNTDDAGNPIGAKPLYRAGEKLAPVQKVAGDLANMAMVMDGARMGAEGVGAVGREIGNAITELPVYKINPWAKGNILNKWNPNAFYRIVDEEGGADALNTGIVRSSPTGTKSSGQFVGKFDLSAGRGTPFPSFAKGKPDVTYIPEDGKGYIFESEVPMYKRGETNPVTGNQIKGRHWAYRPIDMETGVTITELPITDTKMYEPHWLKGFKEVPEEITHQNLTDLYRFQPKNFDINKNTIESIKERVANGTANPVEASFISNPYTLKKLENRDKFFGQWFEKDPNRLDYYINDNGGVGDVLHLKVPKTHAENYSIRNFEYHPDNLPNQYQVKPSPEELNYHATMSLSPNTEFVVPKNIINKAKKYDVGELDRLRKEYNLKNNKK
jgi:hypothetical protein